MYKVVGNLWNNLEFEIISNGKRFFILDGWNGEVYCKCTECLDSKGFDLKNPEEEYVFKPVYKFEIENINLDEIEENSEQWCKATEIIGFEEI